jgi:hypothetical protein
MWPGLPLHLGLHLWMYLFLQLRALLVVLRLLPQRRHPRQAAAHPFLDTARSQQLRYGKLCQRPPAPVSRAVRAKGVGDLSLAVVR